MAPNANTTFARFSYSLLKANNSKLVLNVAITKRFVSVTQTTTPNLGETLKIKPYHEIPTKRGLLPSSLELMINGGPGILHEHCDRRHKELGSIYKEYLGSTELVFVSDTRLIQTVIANEGPYPHHNVPESWLFYNRVKNIQRGLFFQTGESWAKLRTALNKVMLADLSRFTNDILRINSDLLNSWKRNWKVSTHPDGFMIDDVKAALNKWSIESTGFILFGNRMGCIADDESSNSTSKRSRAEELVESVANMFAETSRFQILPVELAYRFNLPTWRRFEAATSNMIRIANEYAKENIAKARQPVDGAQSLVGDILKSGQLNDEEISRSMVDLIIAAADTTSNSLQWMLYLLAKHQDVQLKILEEISPLLEGHSFKGDVKQNAPYLRAFVKEASRLYPTAPFLARTLNKDLVLGGYSVPPGKPIVFSLYTTSRMERYFDEPLSFKPERWMRSTAAHGKDLGCPKRSTKNHAHASLPFGIGSRMCIGRRAAELEMCLFIASFVKEFESSLPDDDAGTGIKLKMILCPSKPIRLKLKSRNKTAT